MRLNKGVVTEVRVSPVDAVDFGPLAWRKRLAHRVGRSRVGHAGEYTLSNSARAAATQTKAASSCVMSAGR